MVTVDDVQEALTNVIDPELGLDFVELGLIYEIEIDEGKVHVTFTLTAPGRSRSSSPTSTASSRSARRWCSRRRGRPSG